ncbi:unnamed protein product, partial [Polarella glacialis]
VRRNHWLSLHEAAREKYQDSGGETRYPFYGRDFGYEVDYMIELGLQPGDRCFAAYRIEALPATHAAATVLRRWLKRGTTGESDASAGSSQLFFQQFDEEAIIEMRD